MVSHESVLLEEVLQWLDPRPNRIIVDGTLGYGGHGEGILERLAGEGLYVGIDQDPAAIKASEKRLERFGKNKMIVHDNFKNISTILKDRELGLVDGVLLDLGVSSPQLDEPTRGFSFKSSGPLDMRMDPSSLLTAKEIVNRYPKDRLETILREYGEERFARRIAERICEARRSKPLETTADLESIVYHAVPRVCRQGRIHPATRTFQGLRLAVNSELEVLETFLNGTLSILAEGGRVAIISFHSLEDRRVKNAFRAWQSAGEGQVLTKKPIESSEAEILRNPRARSAKLRVFERSRGRKS